MNKVDFLEFIKDLLTFFALFCFQQPYYIAPEVFLQNYTPKIDIWSLGVVLYIMLSGKVPFPGNSELEIIGNVIKGDFHFNHKPFQRHSSQAKEFLSQLIRKDVDARLTAEQAYMHPWIQNNAEMALQAGDEQTSDDQFNVNLRKSLDQARFKKACLLYLGQDIHPRNLQKLKEAFERRDPQNSGWVSVEEFRSAMGDGGIPVGDHLFGVILEEMRNMFQNDNEQRVPHRVFLDQLYVSQMYLKEIELYGVLQQADQEGRGGVTITEMKNILQNSEKLQFPEEALSAAFRAMLGADINQVDPQCIVDTEKFIASLHKEFEDIVNRSLSQINLPNQAATQSQTQTQAQTQ